MRRCGELSSWASGLAGQCLPHPAQSASPCTGTPSLPAQALPGLACCLILHGLWAKIGFTLVSWRRISCLTHGEWPGAGCVLDSFIQQIFTGCSPHVGHWLAFVCGDHLLKRVWELGS